MTIDHLGYDGSCSVYFFPKGQGCFLTLGLILVIPCLIGFDINDTSLVFIRYINRLVVCGSVLVHQSEHLLVGVTGVAVFNGICAICNQRARFVYAVYDNLAVTICFYIAPCIGISLAGLNRTTGIADALNGMFRIRI